MQRNEDKRKEPNEEYKGSCAEEMKCGEMWEEMACLLGGEETNW